MTTVMTERVFFFRYLGTLPEVSSPNPATPRHRL